MKKYLAGAVLLVGVQATVAHAGLNLDFYIGDNPPPVVVAQAQPSQPRFYIDETPRFIFTPALGFYVSVGSRYDIVYVRNSYYIYNDGNWFRAHNVEGPWMQIGWWNLPPDLHKHKLDEISRYRDAENRIFECDQEHYRGRWHTPERKLEERHDERRYNHRDKHRYEHHDEHRDER